MRHVLLRAALLAVAVIVLAACSGRAGGTAVSAAGGKVAVPKVVGLRQKAAVRRLHRAGLGARVHYAESLRAVGTVVAQRPAARVSVRLGTRVRIAVSRGPGP